MTEKTESDLVADEQDEFDADRDIVSYGPDELDADDLYDTRMEAEAINAVALAARIEIERQNILTHDGYRPAFGQHELLDIGMVLMSAKQYRFERGATDRVHRISELANAFLDGFELDEGDFRVESVDELPNVDEVKDESE